MRKPLSVGDGHFPLGLSTANVSPGHVPRDIGKWGNVRVSQKPGGGNVQGVTERGERPGGHVQG